jgi:hypothetical protein
MLSHPGVVCGQLDHLPRGAMTSRATILVAASREGFLPEANGARKVADERIGDLSGAAPAPWLSSSAGYRDGQRPATGRHPSTSMPIWLATGLGLPGALPPANPVPGETRTPPPMPTPSGLSRAFFVRPVISTIEPS